MKPNPDFITLTLTEWEADCLEYLLDDDIARLATILGTGSYPDGKGINESIKRVREAQESNLKKLRDAKR